MEAKDDRSKAKRSKMKQFYFRKNTQGNKKPQDGPGTPLKDKEESTVKNCVKPTKSPKVSMSTVPKQDRNYSLPYEDESEDQLNAQIQAPDFEMLSKMPVCSYFQLAVERSWNVLNAEHSSSDKSASDYFTINKRLLNSALRTIPFYERLSFEAELFTGQQLASMTTAAEHAREEYTKLLQIHEETLQENSRRTKSKAVSQKSKKEPTNPQHSEDVLCEATIAQVSHLSLDGDQEAQHSTYKNIIEDQDELEELFNLTNTANVPANVVTLSSNEKQSCSTEDLTTTPIPLACETTAPNIEVDDVQQWLDEVLNS